MSKLWLAHATKLLTASTCKNNLQVDGNLDFPMDDFKKLIDEYSAEYCLCFPKVERRAQLFVSSNLTGPKYFSKKPRAS